MRGAPKPRHPLAAAFIGMTAQAVFRDMQRPPESTPRPTTGDEERQAAAAARRERKNQKRLRDAINGAPF